jgi:cytochrome oxidase Cu insertion factor (SCO1/SenC/PrrC family)
LRAISISATIGEHESMRRTAIASVVAAVIFALSACAGDTSGDTGDGLDTRARGEIDRGAADTAPDFSFETFEGDTFSLAEQRGTPVVLNFWESW